jgi:glycosyltransferase involved in cell wall biosynthesis
VEVPRAHVTTVRGSCGRDCAVALRAPDDDGQEVDSVNPATAPDDAADPAQWAAWRLGEVDALTEPAAHAEAARALAGDDGRRLIEAGIYWQSIQDARRRDERQRAFASGGEAIDEPADGVALGGPALAADEEADADAPAAFVSSSANPVSEGAPRTGEQRGAHAGAARADDAARESAGAHARAEPPGAGGDDGVPPVVRRFTRRLIELAPLSTWLSLSEEDRSVLLELAEIASGHRVGVLGPALARRRAERRTAHVTAAAHGGVVELRARLEGAAPAEFRVLAMSAGVAARTSAAATAAPAGRPAASAAPDGATVAASLDGPTAAASPDGATAAASPDAAAAPGSESAAAEAGGTAPTNGAAAPAPGSEKATAATIGTAPTDAQNAPTSPDEPTITTEPGDEPGTLRVRPGPGAHGPSVPVRVLVETRDHLTGSWVPVPTLFDPTTAATAAAAAAVTPSAARRALPSAEPDVFLLRPTLTHRLRTRAHRSSRVVPREVIAFPHYPNNPFQSILYARLPPAFSLRTPATVEDLLTELAREQDAASPRILHLNWTAPIVQFGPETPEEAQAEVDRFLAALDGFAARGGLLVWTVHNTMPHEVRFREAEVRLSRGIVERADSIITMNPATAALVANDYPLPPERTVVQEHPSYRGRFRDEVTKAEARAALGLAPDAEVLLLFGTLRPYKGVERVLADFERARATRPGLVLLVAGEIGAGFDEHGLRRLLDLDGVLPYLRYVPSDDAQFWLRAADALVLPYLSALNPSLVYLAATFGVPVLLSDLPSLRHLGDEPWVHPVDFSNPVDLPAILDDIDRQRPFAEKAADEFARRTDPSVVAARFAGFLAQLQPRRPGPSS